MPEVNVAKSDPHDVGRLSAALDLPHRKRHYTDAGVTVSIGLHRDARADQ